MKNEYITTRIWKKTLVKLRIIYATTGKSMVAILDDLVTERVNQLNIKNGGENNES